MIGCPQIVPSELSRGWAARHWRVGGLVYIFHGTNYTEIYWYRFLYNSATTYIPSPFSPHVAGLRYWVSVFRAWARNEYDVFRDSSGDGTPSLRTDDLIYPNTVMLLIFTSTDWNHLAKHVPCTPKIIMCFDLPWLNRIHWSLIMTHICVNDLDINSLAPGRCGSTFVNVISEHMLWINFMSTSCAIALMWMPQNIFDCKSTLVQVMAWCHQLIY